MAVVIPAGYLAPAGCWDQTMVDDLLDGTLWPHGLDIRREVGYPQADGILVVPGRYWAGHEDQISKVVERYAWLLLIVTSDEEALFDIGKIEHPNVRFWQQTPRTDREYRDARLFGVGYTPHFRDIPADPPDKTTDVYLAAQNTHCRRQAAFNALAHIPNSTLIPTVGFTQGVEPHTYTQGMLSAKVAPCPSGPASPDSFRVWEALQAHAIPIADDISPGYDSAGYWRMLFPDGPFPILSDYNCLPGWIGDQLCEWPANSNRIQAWWMREKRRMALNLREDLAALGAL